MDGLLEYNSGDLGFTVTEVKRGKVLRILHDNEVITEIHLSRYGAQQLAELLRGIGESNGNHSDARGRVGNVGSG